MPLPVKRALAKLGDDIRTARIRRRIPTALMAERMFFILGMTQRLYELADVRDDLVGQQLEEGRLPKRIRYSAKK